MNVAKEAAEVFPPLKATLGAISAIYDTHKVCVCSLTQSALLNGFCTERGYCQEKDSTPSVTHRDVGDDIQRTFR